MMVSQVLIPDEPKHDEIDALRHELLPLVPAVAEVCGPDDPRFNLLVRALFAPAESPTVKVQRLRLARFALDQAPAETRRRLALWPSRAWLADPAGADLARLN